LSLARYVRRQIADRGTIRFGFDLGAQHDLEYAVADFAVARVAAAAGDRTTYRAFMQRSGGWRHLYNPASGYLEPRYASGAFKPGIDLLGGENLAVALQYQVFSVPDLIQQTIDGDMTSPAWKSWLQKAVELDPTSLSPSRGVN
jgi:hypothetical protein